MIYGFYFFLCWYRFMLIDLCMLNLPCIFGMKPTWLWCLTFLMRHSFHLPRLFWESLHLYLCAWWRPALFPIVKFPVWRFLIVVLGLLTRRCAGPWIRKARLLWLHPSWVGHLTFVDVHSESSLDRDFWIWAPVVGQDGTPFEVCVTGGDQAPLCFYLLIFLKFVPWGNVMK